MGFENIKRLHEHFSKLAEGKFNERDFDIKMPSRNKGDESGRSSMGEFPEARRSLIISDAKRHKEELENKRFPDDIARFGALAGQLCYPFLTEKKVIKEVEEEKSTLKKEKK